MERLAADAGYGAVPGALAEAVTAPVAAVGNADLGLSPATPGRFAFGRWTLLAAMDPDGSVPYAATGPQLLAEDPAWPYGVRSDPAAARRAVDGALALGCSVLFVDQGDLIRADRAAVVARSSLPRVRARALMAADDLLGHIASRLDFSRDLLVVISPTSPAFLPDAHLGVVVARGPGFDGGTALTSAATASRRSPTSRRRSSLTGTGGRGRR
jgi:hypothetical protein